MSINTNQTNQINKTNLSIDRIDSYEEISDSDEEISDSDENNIIKANICKRLSKELQLPEIIYDDMQNYEPPKEHGLSNCNIIIPSYYQLASKSKIFDIDYYEMIKDDIRNSRILNEYQMKYIKELSHEYKNELFDIFNECLKLFNDLMS
jgi:hypothetical protein